MTIPDWEVILAANHYHEEIQIYQSTSNRPLNIHAKSRFMIKKSKQNLAMRDTTSAIALLGIEI